MIILRHEWPGDSSKGIFTVEPEEVERGARDFPGGPVVRLGASTARSTVSVPGQGTKIPHAVQPGQKRKSGIPVLSPHAIHVTWEKSLHLSVPWFPPH